MDFKRKRKKSQPTDNHVKEVLIRRGWLGVVCHGFIETAKQGKWPTFWLLLFQQVFTFFGEHFDSFHQIISWID